MHFCSAWHIRSTVNHQSFFLISPVRLFKCAAVAVVCMTGFFPSAVVRLGEYLPRMCHLIMSRVVYWCPAASLQEKENTWCLSSVKHKKPRSYLVCAGCRVRLPHYPQALNRHSRKVWDDFGKQRNIIMGCLVCARMNATCVLIKIHC